jgi:predicted AlkP superfamily pyrophosphatase or phosphodiesterase
MRKTVVINVVGLTPGLLGPHTPYLSDWSRRGKVARIEPALPAVTCTAQSTYLTGKYPDQHGVVANGWYFRDECEVKFWRQSNHLVQAPKIWEMARELDPTFTCANLFWWYNMYSSVDYSVTPRPMYPADGRKIPDIYTQPAQLRPELNSLLGTFPLFDFWGPRTSIRSSQWIADAAKMVEQKYNPTLTLIYLPHLDYNLQRVGPNSMSIQKDLQEIDAVCKDLIAFFEQREADVIVLSEYGITDVARPIHINRVLRSHGLVAVREEMGLELLDAGASAAFAVADHQVAHIYVNDVSKMKQVRDVLEQMPSIEYLLDSAGKEAHHLNHSRSGDFIAVAERDAWFTYYYWLDDNRAPDFARTVDIHRKPGYDPVELFINPSLRLPVLKVGLTLLKKQLGFRYLMDVIPLDASLVRGSHGAVSVTEAESPLFATQQVSLLETPSIDAASVCQLILKHLTGRKDIEVTKGHSELSARIHS